MPRRFLLFPPHPTHTEKKHESPCWCSRKEYVPRPTNFNTNNIINPNQYGFTNKLSTLHPLLNLTEAISEGFQSKKSTGAVFLDIQKAFDRVWLTGLTYKLINYNIPPPLVFLLHSYNSNRSYQVRVKDTLSTTKFINCGVAQGSLLGPLLFNLYINDIPEYSLTKLNMYADDTAVHTTFKRITSVTFALNKHLKLLEKYYDRWKISINVENPPPYYSLKT
ncbi:probable RNA-directed DNA polymerase from transposon BS [Trichonephila clavipes]|nr:probable RNA-directed DNA polymerase from transposon BS [Trichonephila clavipes]